MRRNLLLTALVTLLVFGLFSVDMVRITANTLPPGASLDLVRRKAWPEHRRYDNSKDEDGYQTLYSMVKNTGKVTIGAGQYKVVWTLTAPTGIASYETIGHADLAPKEITTLMHNISALELSIGRYHVEAKCYYYGMAGEATKIFTFKASRLPTPPDVTGTLQVFEWAGYEIEDLWSKFNETYPNVNVEFSFFIDEAEALTKLKAGYRPDIVHPCFASIPLWYDAGVIEPLNISLIPNWADIFPDIKAKVEEGTVFGGEHYFVPVDWGYSTILYRPDKLEELGIPEKDPVTGAENWNNYTLLFNYRPELEGKIALMDNAVEVMGMAAIAAGVPKEDVWNMSYAQLDLVAAKLEEGKPMVRAYWETPDDVVLMMAGDNPEIVAANTWGYSAITLQNEGWNVTLSDPVQGRFLWTCGFSIVDGFRERKPELWEAAHAFINAWLDPVAGAWLIDNYWYGHSNSKSPDFVEDVETMTALGFDSTDVMATSIIWEYTPNEDDWILIWTEYRA